jgi:hypothetical protein
MKKRNAIWLFVFLLFMVMTVSMVFSQTGDIKPVTLGEKMANFTLPVFGGGEMKLENLKGKNILLIFLRLPENR